MFTTHSSGLIQYHATQPRPRGEQKKGRCRVCAGKPPRPGSTHTHPPCRLCPAPFAPVGPLLRAQATRSIPSLEPAPSPPRAGAGPPHTASAPTPNIARLAMCPHSPNLRRHAMSSDQKRACPQPLHTRRSYERPRMMTQFQLFVEVVEI